MDLDRQSIERRDFPIARRGYDPAAVDAHLRALAAEVEELRRQPAAPAGETLGSAAATQVQGILEAAERTAADIERSATADAARAREEAAQDAERTRREAVERAQAHVAAVAQATAVLRGRVESMDGEVGALIQSLQGAGERLATDLASVETNMGELYDAASGRIAAALGHAGEPAAATAPTPPVPAPPTAPPAASPATVAPVPEPSATQPSPPQPPAASPTPAPVPVASPPPRAPEPPAPISVARTRPVEPPSAPAPDPLAAGAERAARPAAGDIDGARLVALNMALNGESREQADRYLQEHYELADRAKLLDEVYAAIEV